MPEPCQSCEFKEIDFGGCRCQAFALTGDAGNTDPACALSPHHKEIFALADVLRELRVPHETRIVSAHRTPKRLYEYAQGAHGRGLKIIIAGAGGAAHLPGMAAALTHLPVLGVPVESKALKGIDSLLSIAQMPMRA